MEAKQKQILLAIIALVVIVGVAGMMMLSKSGELLGGSIGGLRQFGLIQNGLQMTTGSSAAR